MTFYRVLLAMATISALTLMGCNHDSAPPPNPIPDHLDFTPQSGPALTVDDTQEMKAFFKNNQNDSPSQFLLKADDDKTTQKNREKFQKLSPDLQTAFNNLTSKCEITQPSEQTVKALDYRSKNGQGITLKTSSIGGPNCGMTYESSARTETNMINFDASKLTGDFSSHMISQETESIGDEHLKQLLNFAGYKSNSDVTLYFTYRSGQFERAYMDGTFNVTGNASNHDINISGKMKALIKPANQEAVVYFKLSGFSKDIFFSAKGVSTPEGKLRFIYYVNGQRLSAQDIRDMTSVIELSTGDFAINDDGTVDIDKLDLNKKN